MLHLHALGLYICRAVHFWNQCRKFNRASLLGLIIKLFNHKAQVADSSLGEFFTQERRVMRSPTERL